MDYSHFTANLSVSFWNWILCFIYHVDDESLWTVPLSFCKESKPSELCHSILLSSKQTKVTIPEIEPNEWIKLNPSTVGFYRIKYPAEMLQEFVPSIENKTLPPLDRLGLADDLFALVCWKMYFQLIRVPVVTIKSVSTDTSWTSKHNRRFRPYSSHEKRGRFHRVVKYWWVFG